MIWQYGFLFFQPSGLGLTYQPGLVESVTKIMIEKGCHICSMRLKKVLVKYEKYGTLSIYVTSFFNISY